ncbi:signal peptidase I [Flavobacterium kingsejongi]|uniref:Signal peptidase I n=1 Tax=Flavobacterium kingsejongi TaxID=1678728 RepID=A0A2S1LP83_9FLAO|nr:signal peptidase I [Flavobacterium kingsejongi]AWG25472.1 signal peptidase I [Flavobacterium kingsejongi]
MTAIQWFIFFLILQVIHFLGTWKLYAKAGRKPWEALVPVYNAIVLMKIINRPVWWVILLFIPVINIIMAPVIWVETLRSFGKDKTSDAILGIVTLGFYIVYINYTQDADYIRDRSTKPKNQASDVISSILFAVIVATLVHTYVMQPFTIPTPSLEKSLLVGDYLFVSKFHYGARTPMTEVAFPMVHDTIPVINTKSYLNKPQIPYFRFPAFGEVQKNDIVVFNWPVDTVRYFRDTQSVGIRKPIDKKSNYVKRCVATPGDSIQGKNGVVYINGKELILPGRARPQMTYIVTTDGTQLNEDFIRRELQITDYIGVYPNEPNSYIFQSVTQNAVDRLKNAPNIKSVTLQLANVPDPGIFPYTKNWNVDNFGPIYVPQKGKTVALNTASLPFYKMIITEYEKNDLQVIGDEIRINGKVATSYTFKDDYYWMMGDNRHNSEDSRYWGFVPETHIVGKPVFIWLSLDPNAKGFAKIRWDRMFTTVSGEGQPQSYFRYFLVFVGLCIALDYGIKARKKKRMENQ